LDQSVEKLNKRDYTKIRNIASHYISECRKSRITKNFPVFNHYANLMTGRSDLNFQDYASAKSFSCTLEMEKYLNKKFPVEFDTMYGCLSECQFDCPSGAINVVR